METYHLTETVHCVKILPENYEDVVSQKMSFQIRKCDRDYKVDDFLYLEEFDTDYTGRAIPVKINHILRESDGLKEGYILLNIQVVGLLIRDGKRYSQKL